MKTLFTKSSAEAKVTEEDANIFAKVCEKEINSFTNKNTEYSDVFELFERYEVSHNMYNYKILNDP